MLPSCFPPTGSHEGNAAMISQGHALNVDKYCIIIPIRLGKLAQTILPEPLFNNFVKCSYDSIKYHTTTDADCKI